MDELSFPSPIIHHSEHQALSVEIIVFVSVNFRRMLNKYLSNCIFSNFRFKLIRKISKYVHHSRPKTRGKNCCTIGNFFFPIDDAFWNFACSNINILRFHQNVDIRNNFFVFATKFLAIVRLLESGSSHFWAFHSLVSFPSISLFAARETQNVSEIFHIKFNKTFWLFKSEKTFKLHNKSNLQFFKKFDFQI